MTTEKANKLTTISEYLSGVEIALGDINNVRFPSKAIRDAIALIRKARGLIGNEVLQHINEKI